VTLPALICAGAVLAAGRAGGTAPIGRRQSPLVAAALVIGVVGTLALFENRTLVQSADHARRGDYKQALALARRARWLTPWSSAPWLQTAGIRIQQGRRIDAVDAYRHAVAKDPDDWTLWLGLAAQSRGRARAQAVARLRVLAPSVAQAFAPGKP
jgi:Flp pilus assembly protein TadD